MIIQKNKKKTEAPSKQTMEEDPYLESDVCEGNQPIYSNTQGVYYNYGNHGDIGINKEDDDVYILPDHWKVQIFLAFGGILSACRSCIIFDPRSYKTKHVYCLFLCGFIFVPISYLWEGILKSEH